MMSTSSNNKENASGQKGGREKCQGHGASYQKQDEHTDYQKNEPIQIFPRYGLHEAKYQEYAWKCSSLRNGW